MASGSVFERCWDVWVLIVEQCDRKERLALRSTNKFLEQIASKYLFEELFLSLDRRQFMQLAAFKYASQVKEITFVTDPRSLPKARLFSNCSLNDFNTFKVVIDKMPHFNTLNFIKSPMRDDESQEVGSDSSTDSYDSTQPDEDVALEVRDALMLLNAAFSLLDDRRIESLSFLGRGRQRYDSQFLQHFVREKMDLPIYPVFQATGAYSIFTKLKKFRLDAYINIGVGKPYGGLHDALSTMKRSIEELHLDLEYLTLDIINGVYVSKCFYHSFRDYAAGDYDDEEVDYDDEEVDYDYELRLGLNSTWSKLKHIHLSNVCMINELDHYLYQEIPTLQSAYVGEWSCAFEDEDPHHFPEPFMEALGDGSSVDMTVEGHFSKSENMCHDFFEGLGHWSDAVHPEYFKVNLRDLNDECGRFDLTAEDARELYSYHVPLHVEWGEDDSDDAVQAHLRDKEVEEKRHERAIARMKAARDEEEEE